MQRRHGEMYGFERGEELLGAEAERPHGAR